MATLYKDFIKQQFIGKTVRFTSNCIVKLDVKGTVVDTEHVGSEIIYIVDVGGKLVKIGENTSKLCIEFQ
jgi:hypothetical protein